MNKVLKEAMEIMENADACFKRNLPDLEVGEGYTISDVWDGEGEQPDCNYSYQISDSGINGNSNYPIWVNYKWEVVQEKENFLDTEIRITGIGLL